MNKKWEYCEPDMDIVKRISVKFDVSELLAKVLVNRDIIKDEEIEIFLDPKRTDFYDPFLMPDMKEAVDRILKAIKEKEKVIIYGDYDVDGITSITVLKKFLLECGLDAGYYIPNRLEEGYGLNKEAINEIGKDGYTLIITVDCGISSVKEVNICNELGIETIIVDHHEQAEELPKAFAIINAKRKDSEYPFRGLAGVGVVFKLIQAISIQLGLKEEKYLKYLDLVCIGTISDIVPLIDENRVITKLGLKLIEQTKNVGLRELISKTGYTTINANVISFGIAPRINACGRMGYEKDALQLFLTEDLDETREITDKLNLYNIQRQEKEKEILKQALAELEEENIDKLNSIVLSGDNWHHGVIGIVASKLAETFFKPVILVSFEKEDGKGSGRSVPGFDLHNALILSNKYLEKYGGHEMAVGLSIKKKMFKDFKENFENIACEQKTEEIVPTIKIDTQITAKDINKQILNELQELEPYGEKNRRPVFCYKNLKIDSIRALSNGKHLKLILKDDNYLVNAIGFNIGHLAEEYLIGDKVDIVGMLELNSYNGEEIIQINIRDIMKSI